MKKIFTLVFLVSFWTLMAINTTKVTCPTVTATPLSETLCSGQTTNIQLSSNVANTTYSWNVIPSGVSGCFSGSGNSINQTLTTTGFSSGSVTYIITPYADACTGVSITVSITVDPRPEIFAPTLPQSICSGESTGISIFSAIPGTTFTWNIVQNGVTGAMAGSSSTYPLHISDILTTTGNTSGTAIYTIIPSLNGCSGNPVTITLTVNPLPDINIPDGLICMDESTNTVLTPYVLDTSLSTSDYIFQWYFNGNLIPEAENSTYSADSAGDYRVIATNTTTECTSTATTNVIESYPAQSASATYEEQFDGNYTVTVTTNGSGTYLYQMDAGVLQTSNVFTGVLFGQHAIHVTDSNGCSDLMLNLDLPEIIQQDLAISPNPVTDILTINNDQIITKVIALNHLGQLVFEKESNSKNVQIDLSVLNAGIYFIIIDSDKTETLKIVKN
ncbi:hypothetical protein FLJC2902T_28260 [Flavobacterium limnosediminis JC2902]|uniref:Uncharacterized protein n=1 Tax=Flavobacterium limnosediminis JC2902 TaxID=1341181 RepID=V6SI22_9FLAO|nr:PKD-like domain-containing protein [Flavobacterium limnosediminis]ESU26343.1 hypothetical protein FLJC2902T_28260 [Flavobacterium limnosediminis JC2902]